MSTNLNDGHGSQVSFARAFVAAGNFDGDPSDEIAILVDVATYPSLR